MNHNRRKTKEHCAIARGMGHEAVSAQEGVKDEARVRKLDQWQRSGSLNRTSIRHACLSEVRVRRVVVRPVGRTPSILVADEGSGRVREITIKEGYGFAIETISETAFG
jgi:hypothetical protein